MRLKEAGGEKYFKAENIITLSHQRGADELIHRSIKELATKEQLPFKRMGMNRAYYFLLVISHFIFETYKRDVTNDVMPINTYPNTFRRRIIDFAAKITLGSRYIILNVPRTVFDNFKNIFNICAYFFPVGLFIGRVYVLKLMNDIAFNFFCPF
ncbi:MAG: hypothetical protein GY756_27090 [bacterium]|nr:hypothetical protein [bacterium]